MKSRQVRVDTEVAERLRKLAENLQPRIDQQALATQALLEYLDKVESSGKVVSERRSEYKTANDKNRQEDTNND